MSPPQGLIELRGGAPLLEMLPDVFEWPIAVDNWEAAYGRGLFMSAAARRGAVYSVTFLLSFFHFPVRGKMEAGGRHCQAEREVRDAALGQLFRGHR